MPRKPSLAGVVRTVQHLPIGADRIFTQQFTERDQVSPGPRNHMFEYSRHFYRPSACVLNDELKTVIEKCQWLSAKRPFLYGDFKNEAYPANKIYYRMLTIGERCGVADCCPHRLRDTKVVAPRHGFEPRLTAPKAAVLPLDDRGL